MNSKFSSSHGSATWQVNAKGENLGQSQVNLENWLHDAATCGCEEQNVYERVLRLIPKDATELIEAVWLKLHGKYQQVCSEPDETLREKNKARVLGLAYSYFSYLRGQHYGQRLKLDSPGKHYVEEPSLQTKFIGAVREALEKYDRNKGDFYPYVLKIADRRYTDHRRKITRSRTAGGPIPDPCPLEACRAVEVDPVALWIEQEGTKAEITQRLARIFSPTQMAIFLQATKIAEALGSEELPTQRVIAQKMGKAESTLSIHLSKMRSRILQRDPALLDLLQISVGTLKDISR